MKYLWLCAFVVLVACSRSSQPSVSEETAATPVAKADEPAWENLFDGATLSGWTAPDPGDWKVENGILIGTGKVSHLFSPNTYTNLEIKAEVKLNHRGNSGIYLRAELGKGWPKGYETQVENTSPDPQKTGSLYNAPERKYNPPPVPVLEQLVEDDTWWTQHVIAIGNRIIVKVNGKIVTDFVDQNKTFASGHFAFQQHDPGSVVQFRNVVAKRLPDDEAAAWEEAKKSTPEIASISK